MSEPANLAVGKDGFIYVDGVRIGRHIPERETIQFIDRDRRRCQEKGRDVVEIRIIDLANLTKQK